MLQTPLVLALALVLAALIASLLVRRLCRSRVRDEQADRRVEAWMQEDPPRQPRQPQQPQPRRRVLVLDLDETLGHSVELPGGGMGFIRRPHLSEFLRAVAARFDELVLFTAGTREYARPIVDAFDTDRLFGRRFYRDSCSIGADGSFVKDLRILREPDLSDVLILDNTPSAYALQPQCGVPIESFYGSPDDDALLAALEALSSRDKVSSPTVDSIRSA
jgi:Dullard-like phosphatase family protein